MADTPPPAPKVYSSPSPAQVRARRLIELGILCFLAAAAAFYAGKQLTAHRTVVVDRPTAWIESAKK